MPRSGQNPIKLVKDVPQSAEVTVTTAVYIPYLDGFWKESLDVLKLCLQSMRSNTQVVFDLAVFDNGSCKEVRDYLLQLYERDFIQQLYLSRHNVGKVGAWNVLFTAVQSPYISYCDSDIYFFEGWLEESLAVLQAFPKAGVVTAQPIAGHDLSKMRTAQMAIADPTVETKQGVLIPDKYVRACLIGLGGTEAEYEERQVFRNDFRVERNGVRAYTSASHFQLTSTRDVLQQLFPDKPEMLLGKDFQFEDKMLDLGYWRLSTETYLVHHMGNHCPDLAYEVPWINAAPSDEPTLAKSKQKLRFERHSVRRFLKWLNATSYRLLNAKKGS